MRGGTIGEALRVEEVESLAAEAAGWVADTSETVSRAGSEVVVDADISIRNCMYTLKHAVIIYERIVP